MIDESGIKRIAPEKLRRHFLARDQSPRLGVGRQLAHVLAETHRQGVADPRHRDRAEAKEQNRLQDVDPDRSPHAAKEHVQA
jgi:hypothetical protein